MTVKNTITQCEKNQPNTKYKTQLTATVRQWVDELKASEIKIGCVWDRTGRTVQTGSNILNACFTL